MNNCYTICLKVVSFYMYATDLQWINNRRWFFNFYIHLDRHSFWFFFVQNVNSSDIKTEAILLTIYQDKA